ncbi:MAG: cytochrome c-type biogenesis protein [Pseudomonadota bacterium]
MKAAVRGTLVALCLALSAPLPAGAVQPDEMLADPALEARAREISKDVRCLVCRNESIDDSSAELARDLRLVVRERLVAGDSDAEVREFLVARYGEFVLLTPRFTAENAFLWLSGPVMLLLGGTLAWFWVRRQGVMQPKEERIDSSVDAPLTPEERADLDRFL